MDALLPRLIGAAASTLIGALLGRLLGELTGHALVLAIAGAVIGAVFSALRDRIAGQRIMSWLRAPESLEAPRAHGFWGELGYRAERALRTRERQTVQERERLEAFLSGIEASPNGVLLLDENDRIEWCNSVAADHFGLDPGRDRLQRATNLLRAPAFVAALQERRWDEAVAVPARSAQGLLSVMLRPYGDGKKLVLSQDVTERERTDAMRRDFVANVSHEIRTPLTVLSGFIETLSSLPLTPVERERVHALMQQQAGRIEALVTDLLTLAQLEGSPRPPPDRWIALAELLRAIETEASALSAGRHRIRIVDAGGVQIAGAAHELQSAIGNLVTNAVRYTPEGGQIEVGFLWREDGSGLIEVTDTGIGIAREHLPRLTERFYRVDGSRSRETGGTGLGLAIVKHVIQRHGGEIDVQSEPGRGSRFRLVLPAVRLRRENAAAGAEEASVGAPVDGDQLVALGRAP
jgi:two-component system phosphate regulon sensor histidine kinase PhoR